MAEEKKGGLDYLKGVNPTEADALEAALARARAAGEATLRAGQKPAEPAADQQSISPAAAAHDPGDEWADGETWPKQDAERPNGAMTLQELARAAGVVAAHRKQ